jgi:hypothetical protein
VRAGEARASLLGGEVGAAARQQEQMQDAENGCDGAGAPLETTQ